MPIGVHEGSLLLSGRRSLLFDSEDIESRAVLAEIIQRIGSLEHEDRQQGDRSYVRNHEETAGTTARNAGKRYHNNEDNKSDDYLEQ